MDAVGIASPQNHREDDYAMNSAATRAAEAPTITPYTMVGGEAGVRRLIERFYDIMDADPAASGLRAMHGADLGPVREKLFEFMSGWLGGPPLYRENRDRKCIVSVHSGYAIDAEARDQWLACMRRAMADIGLPPEVRRYLDEPLVKLADFFRNR